MNSYFDNVTTSATNISNITDVEKHFCFKVLYWTLPQSQVRLWDLLILIPNVLFVMYLLCKFDVILTLLRRFNRQIFIVLFFLVFISHVLSITRCVVSMSVHSLTYDTIDRAMWLVMKFFLLATELSVVTFGFFFGHLDSRTSIKRVLIVTFMLSLIYSTTQGVLEFLYKNDSFHNIHDGLLEYTLFGHGGIIFWFTTSFVLFFIYTLICILPLTPLRLKLTIPAKKSFYMYCLVLSVLNLCQAVGGVLLFRDVVGGMCVVDVTTFLYFAGFPPLVYIVFLHSFFSRKRSPTLMFSYRTQTEEYDDDDDDDEDLYVPPPHTSIDFIDDVDHQLLDAVDSGTYTGTPPTGLGSNMVDNHFEAPFFENSSLAFSYNPFCPTLTNRPDLTLSTPSNITSSINRLEFPTSNNVINKLSVKDNKLKTFPA